MGLFCLPNVMKNAEGGIMIRIRLYSTTSICMFTGDYEGDVAEWKGEVQAIETAQIINKCKSI